MESNGTVVNIGKGARLLTIGTMLGILLAACGGGGGGGTSGGTTTSTFQGTGAVGFPIINATVKIICQSGGTLTATTNYQGGYSVTLSGQTAPCFAELSGGTIQGTANTLTYHSVAVAPGTMNITPFTDLAVGNITGKANLGSWFLGLTGGSMPTVTSAIEAGAVAAEAMALGMSQISNPLYNPFTSSFTPAPGTVQDDMLASLQLAMTSTSTAWTTLQTDAAAPGFTSPGTTFTSALNTAYTGTLSGGKTAPAGTMAVPITTTYIDFNYLQNVNGAASAVSATITDNGTSTQTNNLVFGPTPTTASFNPVSGGGYSWSAPLSYGNGFNSSLTDSVVPAAAMLCESNNAAGNSFGLGKSYDVLVNNSAQAITDATQLAGLSLTTYQEDCGTVIGNSAVVDASGNVTFTANPNVSLTASQFTAALTGTPTTAGGGYTTFNAYSYTNASGGTKYVLVEHGGNTATGPTSGYVGLWRQ